MKDHDMIYIVDITVHYENNNSLRKAYNGKCRKYKEMAEILKMKLDTKESRVLPVLWVEMKNFEVLGFQTKHETLTDSLIALRSK